MGHSPVFLGQLDYISSRGRVGEIDWRFSSLICVDLRDRALVSPALWHGKIRADHSRLRVSEV